MDFVIWKNLCNCWSEEGIKVEKEFEGFLRGEICSFLSGFLYVSWSDDGGQHTDSLCKGNQTRV